jgi:ABC-type uncharacterized transport system involved in gliding motility auxiliary subunit
MSKQGKILYGFAIIAFLILGAARLVYGGWHPAFWVPLGLFVVCLAAGIFFERERLREILTLRTTKHGMNMGALIVITLVGLTCVNFLAVKYEKKFDWTNDKFNSLSEQSVAAAKNLKADTEFVFLYRKDPQNPSVDRGAAMLADLYRNINGKIKYASYDALTRPDLAQKFEYTFGPYIFYAVQGERKVKIDPISEESVTRALVKLGRDKKKAIYFTRGHGELLLDDKEVTGLSILNDDLAVAYDVKPLALVTNGNKIPEDAAAIAIMGPKQQFQDGEIQALRSYAQNGGHLLIALEPGQKQNLTSLVRSFGVDFMNDWILDGTLMKKAPTLVSGTEFSPTSEITKAFGATANAITVFEGASELKKAADVSPTLVVEDLVKTPAVTATVPELKESVVYKQSGPHTVAMTVKGHIGDGKDFSAVIFGDADFASNRLIQNNSNRDVFDNSMAWLTSDKDLISIRPREPKGTVLNMPTGTFNLWSILILMVPLALFGTSIGLWLKRRMA